METKSGPIQHICLHNVTRLDSVDLVVSDSRGIVTVFHKDQLLTPRAVSTHNVTALQIQQDATGGISIVTGDSEGNITAFNIYKDVLWKLRLSDAQHNKVNIIKESAFIFKYVFIHSNIISFSFSEFRV